MDDRAKGAGTRAGAPWALLIVGVSLAIHLALAGAVTLSPQEAYYWQWARHLDLSYVDHPPLAAWTVRLTTAVLGATERGVRAAAALHAALFALFLFLAGRRLFGARAAVAAVLAAAAAPLFALGQTVITPDGPLLAGWAAALYFTARALDEERGAWLLAAGVATGWAALGKYSGWLLPPQIVAALLLDRRGRRLLRTPWPWLGLAAAVALFAPVLAWNARHGWASFALQLGHRAATAGAFSGVRVARFLGLQLVALSPLLAAAAAGAAVVAARRGRDPAFRLCALFACPGLALCLALSPFLWVKGNWPAFAWPAALLAAAAQWAERPTGARRALAWAALGTAAATTLYLHAAIAWSALPFPARDDVTRGWRELAFRVQAERAALPGDAFVLGCSYKVGSELAWLLPDRPEVRGERAMGGEGLQYDVWAAASDVRGRDGLLVLDDREPRGCADRARRCRSLEPLPPVEARRGERPVTTFRLWRCRGAAPAG